VNEPKSLEDVVRSHRNRIMQIAGVIGIAGGLSQSGSGQKCVLVYSTSADWPDALPHEIDGFSVELVVRRRGFRAL
jgi:hypothetical protein